MMRTKQTTQRQKRMLKALFAATVVACGVTVNPALAQNDASWDGSSGPSWNQPNNWTPADVPEDDALFGNVPVENGQTNVVVPTTGASIDSIQFFDGPDSEEFTITANGVFEVGALGTGEQGIINNSDLTQTFNVGTDGSIRFQNEADIVGDEVLMNNLSGGTIIFQDDSSAGIADITNANGSATRFTNRSDAGEATITNNLDGTTVFTGDDAANFSSAADATIINNDGGLTRFTGSATSGSATIINNEGGITRFFENSIAGTDALDPTEITNDGLGALTQFTDNASAGTADITNSNGGATTFSGDSTAANSTITNEFGGTATFNDNSFAGSATITNEDGGITFFNDDSSGPLATVINEEGGLLDISGVGGVDDNLRLGSVSGAGDINLGDNELTVGNLDQDDVISGVIRDDGLNDPTGVGGSLTKQGDGTLTLTNNNTYTGETRITGGTLTLDGATITSDTIIQTDGTLRGDGTIGDILAPLSPNSLTNNDGTIDPGTPTNPYGELNVTGDVVINDSDPLDGSDFPTFVSRVTRDADGTEQSNALIANGTVTLDGQVVAVVDPDGTYLTTNRFLIIRGESGRIDEFDGLFYDETGTPYLAADIEYTPTDAYLVLRRTSLEGVEEGDTENQQSLFNALNDSFGDELNEEQEEFINAFIVGDGGDRNLLTGDALTAYPLVAFGVSNRFNQRMLTQLLQESSRVPLIAGVRTPRMVYTGTRYASMAAPSSPLYATVGGPEVHRSNVWAIIARAREEADSDGNGPGYDARATEYQVGVSRNFSARTVGTLSIGKSDGRVDINDRAAEGDLDTTSIGASLRHDSESWYASGLLSYSRHDVDSRRQTGLGQVSGDTDGRTVALWGEVGQKLASGAWSIEPHLSLKISNTRLDGFSENGPGGLEVGNARFNSRRVGIGARVATRDVTARIRPHLFVGYERELGDNNVTLNNQFPGLASFQVEGTELGKNIFSARLGADARISDQFSLVGEIGGSWRSNQDSQYIYGGVKYSW